MRVVQTTDPDGSADSFSTGAPDADGPTTDADGSADSFSTGTLDADGPTTDADDQADTASTVVTCSGDAGVEHDPETDSDASAAGSCPPYTLHLPPGGTTLEDQIEASELSVLDDGIWRFFRGAVPVYGGGFRGQSKSADTDGNTLQTVTFKKSPTGRRSRCSTSARPFQTIGGRSRRRPPRPGPPPC